MFQRTQRPTPPSPRPAKYERLLAFCVLVLCVTVAAPALPAVPKTIGNQEILPSKVDQALLALASSFQTYQKQGLPTPFQPPIPMVRVVEGRVVVDAVAIDDGGTLRSALEALGLQHAASYGKMVSGQLPLAAVPQLEALGELKFIQPSYMAAGVGLVTSQGDTALRAAASRTEFGVDGTGVTIGTLSDSYDCLGGATGDVTNGDLPSGIVVLEEEPGCSSGTDEGRGMMQIIADIAPGAAQAFHTGFNGQADMATGINDLANTANCDIICDDVFYFAEPFFQDGVIAQAVDNVVSQGIPYFALAGNHGRKSYESDFASTSTSPTGYANGDAHDFNPGAGVDIYQNVTIPNNTSITVSFQWDQPFFSVSGGSGSANDMDILLYDNPPTTILASSANFNVGGDPVEVLNWTNNTGASIFNIALVKNEAQGGPDPGHIKYIALVNGALNNFVVNEYDTASSTVYGHMNSSTGETVGAAFYDFTPAFGTNPPLREAYSSAGPTRILFDVNGNPVSQLRNKPNIVAVDGTNTTFFGSDINDPGDGSDTDIFPNFFGTSAATPHAAAVAALVWEVQPGLTPAQLYGVLESTTIDMAAAGFDFDTGFGLIQADLALCTYDMTAPDITCPGDITVECDASGGVPHDDPQLAAFFAGVSATDFCDDSVDITDDAPTFFPGPCDASGGVTVVTWTATDDALNSSQCSATVTVEDNTAPEFTKLELSRDVLWPPNHKMSSITVDIEVSDVCDPDPSVTLVSVTSSEPDNGIGDGDTVNDIQGVEENTDDRAFSLRSERSGKNKDGRTYTITYRVEDCSGNFTVESVYVRVPHSQSANAMTMSGFTADGTALDAMSRFVEIAIPSVPLDIRAAIDPDLRQPVLFELDARQVLTNKIALGNSWKTAKPLDVSLEDVDHDGASDLVLTFSSFEVRSIALTSIENGAVGVQFRTEPLGGDHIVKNLFLLGSPMNAAESEPTTTAARDESMSIAPNPFNPRTTFSFSLANPEHVHLGIYNLRGILVESLVDEQLAPGPHEYTWEGRDHTGRPVASGFYVVRLERADRVETQKITLLK
jgi:hypothetical protein